MENRSRRLRNLAQFKRPTLNQAELVDREFQRFQQPREVIHLRIGTGLSAWAPS